MVIERIKTDRSMSPSLTATRNVPPRKKLKKKRLKKRTRSKQISPQNSNQQQKTLSAYYPSGNNVFSSLFDGEKFPGGFANNYGYGFEYVDYWELRNKSVQLFTENLYASGLINRLVTNIINTGLSLEATPSADILGIDDDQLEDWSEKTESLFRIWGNNKDLVDWKKQNTMGELQALAKKTAYISGDCLVMIRQSSTTGLPVIELIDGRFVRNPLDQKLKKAATDRGNRIIHGVELDKNGRHVAFYVTYTANEKVEYRRIPANGPKSGRKIAWLLYGSKRLLDDVRGMPLLGLVAQSLKEIDRYRDSEQRAAVVNSMLAMFVTKNSDKPGTRPLSGGAVRKDTETVTDGDGTTREFSVDKWLPGMSIDELQQGEEPVSFDTKRPSTAFNVFEDAIISAIAWGNEIPPEVLKLSFTSNFSSSRQANSEFKMFLDKDRSLFASNFCKPIYQNWLISMVLTNRIEAEKFLQSWRDVSRFDIFGAWIDSDWSGAIKPHVDPLKETNAYKIKDEQGYSTKARSTRELSGMKFSRNVKQLKKENQLLADAQQPLIDAGLMNNGSTKTSDQTDLNNFNKVELTELLSEIIQEKIDETLEMVN